MPNWPRPKTAVSTSATVITTTTETVLVATPSVSTDGGAQAVDVAGVVGFTVGTGTTTVTVRIRRGNGITGTVVNSIAGVQVTAGNTVQIPIDGTDNPGEVADQQYSLTVAQAGATANGTNVLSAGTATPRN